MSATNFFGAVLAHYKHLPIYKATFDLLMYFEKIVARFSRYQNTFITRLRMLDSCLEYIIRAIQRVVVIEKRNQSPPYNSINL
jgi:hypothetical protein